MHRAFNSILLLSLFTLTSCNSETLEQQVSPNASFRCDSSTQLRDDTLRVVNSFRSQFTRCGNDLLPPVNPVTWNTRLESAAQVHANDMATRDFVDHRGTDGSDPATRIQDQGYNWASFGENLEAGSQSSASAIADHLINSPPHCRTIMRADVTEMGMACAQNSDSFYGTYHVQILASPL